MLAYTVSAGFPLGPFYDFDFDIGYHELLHDTGTKIGETKKNKIIHPKK